MIDLDRWEPERWGEPGPILPVDVARRLVREWAAINGVSFAFDFDLRGFELSVREDERRRLSPVSRPAGPHRQGDANG